MKKYIFLFSLLLSLAACKEAEVELYDGVPYVALYDANSQHRLVVQSYQQNFSYGSKDRTRDTLWIKLVAVGNVPQKDVHVGVRSYHNTVHNGFMTSMKDAEPGVHFVPFDSPEMKELLVFHAGNLHDSIPVILLRDKSLQEEGRRINIRLFNTDEVLCADQRADDSMDHATAVVYTADCLTQPTKWTSYFFLGAYGQVKHDFMIRHSGEVWDDAFLDATGLSGYSAASLQAYYRYKFRNELLEENEQRAKDGLPPLTEKNGIIVDFPAY